MKKNETVTINAKPVYTIVAGVDGCGKTGFIGALTGAVPSAGSVTAAKDIARGIDLGTSMVQEIAVLDERTLQLMTQAKARGYEIRLYYIALDSQEEHLRRIANSDRHSGLEASPEEVLCQYQNRWCRLDEALPLCDRAEFYDNGNGFVCAARYENGRIISDAGTTPRWLEELKMCLLGAPAPVDSVRLEVGKYMRDDLYYVAALIEYMGRKTKNRRGDVVRCLGKEAFLQLFGAVDAYYGQSFEQVSDELIVQHRIPAGGFLPPAGNIPYYWHIGGDYARLIRELEPDPALRPERMYDVFLSHLPDAICDFRTHLYSAPASEIRYYYETVCRG